MSAMSCQLKGRVPCTYSGGLRAAQKCAALTESAGARTEKSFPDNARDSKLAFDQSAGRVPAVTC